MKIKEVFSSINNFFKQNDNETLKTKEFLNNEREKIKKLLLLFSSFDTLGLSYKDNFKYEIFFKPEELKKKIDLFSKQNLDYELEKGEITEFTEVLLIFLINIFDNNLKLNLEKLKEDLYYWFNEKDPFNVDTALKMSINSNSVSIENNSNNWVARTLFFLILFKNYYSKENIKDFIFQFMSFTNNNELSNKCLDFLIDLVYLSKEDVLISQENFIKKYIDNNIKISNNDVCDTLKIIFFQYFKNTSIEKKVIQNDIKEIILSKFDTNITLPSFILLKFNENEEIFNIFNFNDFLNEKNIKKIENFLI